MIRSEGPKLSLIAQNISCWGILGYQFALTIAAIWLAVTTAFGALMPGHSAEVIVIFAFIGIIPAILVTLFGYLARLAFRCISVIYDPAIFVFTVTFRKFSDVALFGWHSFVRPTIENLQSLFRIVTDVLLVWAKVVRSTYRLTELYLAIGFVFGVFAVVAIDHSVGRIRLRSAHMATCCIQACISSVCMFAPLRALTCRHIVAPWRAFVFIITFPVRLVAQVLIRIIPSVA